MDPVSAVGLASAILTFVDFGWELITGAVDVYRSRDGMTDDNASLQDIIGDLSEVVEDLGKDVPANTKEEKRIKRLAKECQEDAMELMDILRKLKMKGKRTVWRSVKTKWASMRVGDEVEELKERLRQYRSEILINLVLVLREGQSAINQRIKSINDDCKDLNTDFGKHLTDARTDLLKAIQHRTDAEIKSADGIESSLADIIHLLGNVGSLADTISIEHRILRQLAFDEMGSRRVQIRTADRTTCKWLLEREPDDQKHRFENEMDRRENRDRDKTRHAFRTWLRSGQNILHISGNAESGKSTLMKFVASHNITQTLL